MAAVPKRSIPRVEPRRRFFYRASARPQYGSADLFIPFCFAMKNIRLCFAITMCVCALQLVGCRPSAPYTMAQLEGTVTYQGKPLENVTLEFSVGDNRPSSAMAKAGGKFKAIHTPSIDGVPVGKCIVRVSWSGMDDAPADLKELFEKYGYGSPGKEIEITKTDKNYQLDFE